MLEQVEGKHAKDAIHNLTALYNKLLSHEKMKDDGDRVKSSFVPPLTCTSEYFFLIIHICFHFFRSTLHKNQELNKELDAAEENKFHFFNGLSVYVFFSFQVALKHFKNIIKTLINLFSENIFLILFFFVGFFKVDSSFSIFNNN